MAIIGSGLLLICALASFILYIVSVVKAFKAGDTLWGVLNLLLGLGVIWFFLNGQKKLGMYCVFAYIGIVVGMVLAGMGAVAAGTVG